MISGLLERNPRIAHWLYGFKPPERGTVVLVHRRVYIVPTRMGWLFGAAVGLLLLGSVNYALGLGFVLTFMLAGLGLAAMAHTARNLAHLGLSAGRAEPVFAGEPAQFRIHLESRAGQDRPAILTRHLGSGAQLVVDIPAHGMAEVVLEAPAQRRGWLPIGRLMLETRYPLGLFRAWSYAELDARCLVYPRPERSPLPAAAAHEAAGGERATATGSEDFSGLRTYQLSDSPRHVAWKAVARADDMLTKQFSGEAAAQLWLDWQRLPAALGTEQRLSRLAGWVLAAERSGARYGLRLPGAEIAPARGDSHAAACLQALALYRAS
ncbi:MAG TPA: DUF58 domain-containing protein [Burkholderiales bacterium]|nr:DUF58 domain-containing protein [Burkholderiales bacterium]